MRVRAGPGAAVSEVVALLVDAPGDLDPDAAGDRVAQTWRSFFLEPAPHPVDAVLGTPVTAVRAVPEAVNGLDRLPDGRVRLHLADTALILDAPAGQRLADRPADPAGDAWSGRELPAEAPPDDAVALVGGLLKAGVVRRA